MLISVLICLLLSFASSSTRQAFQLNPLPQHSAASGYESHQAPSLVQDPYSASVQRPHQDIKQPQSSASIQETYPFFQPLSWRFPEIKAKEPMFPSEFKLKEPVPIQSVTVQCGENTVRVEAQKDLLGIGKPVLTKDVLLGDCPATSEDSVSQVLIFESELHACGSQLMMTEDSFVYVFTLHYVPSPLGNSPIIRTREISITIECHYQRKQDVSSKGINPTWMPFVTTLASEDSLYFSLKLMTDDWQHERPSQQFLLGDTLRLEASVQQFSHVPLRVFVDRCVATLIPNTNTVPRYSFLDDYGCMMDSKLTSSSSQFLPRTQDDKLQFQIEVFRFQQDKYGMLYITCELRATIATTPILPTNKACSFSDGRWIEASGKHNTCSCCDTDCGAGRLLNLLSTTGSEGIYEKAIGPIHVNERPRH